MRQHQPDLVAIASGKGGVGKSTISVNLALALRDLGVRTGLVDADLHGPDIPRMLNLTRRTHARTINLWDNPKLGRTALEPFERLGVKVLSSQLLMGEDQAFATEATFAGMLLRRFVEAEWGDTQVLVVDLPPGTGDMVQSLARIRPISGVILVVTPQDVAHLDARKLVAMLRTWSIPILGGVENMAPLQCPSCDERIELFPPTPAERTIWRDGVELLASVPFDPALGRADQRGVPVVVAEPDAPATGALRTLADAVARAVR